MAAVAEGEHIRGVAVWADRIGVVEKSFVAIGARQGEIHRKARVDLTVPEDEIGLGDAGDTDGGAVKAEDFTDKVLGGVEFWALRPVDRKRGCCGLDVLDAAGEDRNGVVDDLGAGQGFGLAGEVGQEPPGVRRRARRTWSCGCLSAWRRYGERLPGRARERRGERWPR